MPPRCAAALPSPPPRGSPRASLLLSLLLGRSLASAPVASWNGTFVDPTGTRIEIRQAGSALLASAAHWEVEGSVEGDGTAHLAGLDGRRDPALGDIVWSNGARWAYERHEEEGSPSIAWEGKYVDDTRQSLYIERLRGDEVRVASSSWEAAGHVKDGTIFLLGHAGHVSRTELMLESKIIIICKRGSVAEAAELWG